MGQVTPGLVKELREKTGAGMMDCKKALTETGGDLEGAVDWLRKKGLATAAKKAGRVAAEGLVGVIADGGRGAVLEVNAETDFVARNPEFQEFVGTCTRLALEVGGDLDALNESSYSGGDGTVSQQLTELVARIGENMRLRRSASLEVETGAVACYVHNQVAPGLGKIGTLVALESTADQAKLEDFARQIAMHVAAARPQAVDRDSLDSEAVEREREVLREQATASGKPADVVEKMVEGRLRKFYEEVCLLDQTFVIDGERKVGQAVEDKGAELGAPIVVAGFQRFQLGEGIEKEEKDFAAEVAATMGG